MYHSITFGEKNTWDDWKLIPSSRPIFAPPEVRTSRVDIPGGDGILDLTEALAGRPTYNNRTGSFSFAVTNSYDPYLWAFRYSEIMNYLHGKRMRAILEDDPFYFYEGRFTVSSWSPGNSYSSVTIDYDVAPYKYDINAQDKTITVKSSGTVVLRAGPAPIAPIFEAKAAMSVKVGASTYLLRVGNNYFPEMVLSPGENSLIFTGNGQVTVKYRGGSL